MFVKIARRGEQRKLLCPFCQSESYFEKAVEYCRFCGAKVKPGVKFCSKSCAAATKRLTQATEKKKASFFALSSALAELEEYNRTHSKSYSYGQYFALKGINAI